MTIKRPNQPRKMAPQGPWPSNRRQYSGYFASGQVAFQVENWRRYGDLFRYQVGPYLAHTVVLRQQLRQVLAQHRENYEKGPGYAKTRELLGYGLLTSEGELWQHQRLADATTLHPQECRPVCRGDGRGDSLYVGALGSSAWSGCTHRDSRGDYRLTLNIIGQGCRRLAWRWVKNCAELVSAYSVAATFINLRLTAFFDLPLAGPPSQPSL